MLFLTSSRFVLRVKLTYLGTTLLTLICYTNIPSDYYTTDVIIHI